MPKGGAYSGKRYKIKNPQNCYLKSDCVPALLLDFVLVSLVRGDHAGGEQILAELVDALLQQEAGNQGQFLAIGRLLATVAVDRQPLLIQAK